MRIIKFVDAATTDEHYYPANRLSAIEVTDNNTVKVWADINGELTPDIIELTCTGTTNATTVATKMAEYMCGGTGTAYNGIYEVKASSGDFTLVTTVAHSAGS